MLETPLGKLLILADNQPVVYEAEPYIFDRPPVLNQPIAGCFRIRVSAERYTAMCCMVETNDPNMYFSSSSGEGYLAAEFESGRIILTIGAEDEHPSLTPEVIPGGIVCTIRKPVQQLVFGVAWTDDYQGTSDVRTWYAADPTLDK